MRKIYRSLVRAGFNRLDITSKMMLVNRRGKMRLKKEFDKKEARIFELYNYYVLVIYDLPEFNPSEVKSISIKEIKKRFPEFHFP